MKETRCFNTTDGLLDRDISLCPVVLHHILYKRIRATTRFLLQKKIRETFSIWDWMIRFKRIKSIKECTALHDPFYRHNKKSINWFIPFECCSVSILYQTISTDRPSSNSICISSSLDKALVWSKCIHSKCWFRQREDIVGNETW